MNDKSKATLRNRLLEVKFLIIDEFSIVSRFQGLHGIKVSIGRSLGETIMIPEKEFPGLSVVTLSELLQVTPVRGKLIFSHFSDKDSMKHLLGLQLWHLFNYAELIEVVRQRITVYRLA